MISLNLPARWLLFGLIGLAMNAVGQEPRVPFVPRQFNGWTAADSAQKPSTSRNQQVMYQAPEIAGFPTSIAPQGVPQPNFPVNSPVVQAQHTNPQFANPQLTNQQVVPPSNSSANPPVLPPDLRSGPQGQFGANGLNPLTATDLANPSSLRQFSSPTPTGTQPTAQPGTQIRSIQQDYVTGPPFVSPPPSPRVGNFPTSPYQNAPFQLISYQNAGAPRGQFQLPVSTQVAALPQNQPVVGIYPTSYQNCAPGITGPSFPATGAVPNTFAPPTLPPNLTPGLYTPDNAGYTPLLSLGQENYNVLLGRGIIGQPTVYVPGQPFRNFLRYLSP